MGKTAVEVYPRIVNSKCRRPLRKAVLALDLPASCRHAVSRQFEERLKRHNEVREQSYELIVFIDDCTQWLGAGAEGSMGPPHPHPAIARASFCTE